MLLTSANASARILSKRCLSSSSSTPSKLWNVYLSGEIHSDWREVIAKGVQKKELPVHLTSPNTCHEDSDDCGKIILKRPGALINNVCKNKTVNLQLINKPICCKFVPLYLEF